MSIYQDHTKPLTLKFSDVLFIQTYIKITNKPPRKIIAKCP